MERASGWELIEAAASGNTGEIRELLETGADVNARDNYGRTALMWAASEGHTEAIRELLKVRTGIADRGEQPEAVIDFQELRREMWALGRERPEAIAEGIGSSEHWMWAADREQPEATNPLLRSSSLAMWAADREQAETIRELLNAGVDKLARDNNGWTAFDYWQHLQKDHPDFQEISELLRP